MIYLKIADDEGRELDDVTSSEDRITIGSAAGSSLYLLAPGISALHATIDAKSLTITDCGTLPTHKGVLVNGKPVASTALENGDVIQIGFYTIKFFHDGAFHDGARDTRTWKVDSLHTKVNQQSRGR